MTRVFTVFLVLILSPLFQNLTLITQANDISEAKWAAQGGYITYLERRAATSAIFRIDSDGSHPQTVVANTVSPQMPRLSPDGNQIVYVLPKDGQYVLHLVNADGSQDRPLLTLGSLPTTLAWSPNGSKILLRNNDGLSVINPANADRTSLPFTQEDSNYTWSPDGSKIAFLQNNGSNNVSQIWLMDAGSGNSTPLFTLVDPLTLPTPQDPPVRTYFSGVSLAWAPDQQKIAFEYYRADEYQYEGPHGITLTDTRSSYRLAVINADGSGFTLLLAKDSLDIATIDGFSWSPDSKKLVYSLNGGLTVVNSDGSQPNQLAIGTGAATQPVWSPDGSKIAFLGYVENGVEIYTITADGSDLQRLTNNDVGEQALAWAPDSAFLVFEGDQLEHQAITDIEWPSGRQSTISGQRLPVAYTVSPTGRQVAFRDTSFQEYIANTDGSGVTQLAVDTSVQVNSGNDMFRWSPDGQSLIYLIPGGPLNFYDVKHGVMTYLLPDLHPREVVWLPDGHRIAVIANDHIYTLNRDGSNLEQFDSPLGPSHLVSSPTAHTLAALGAVGGAYGIYLLDPDSRSVSQLTPLDTTLQLLRWSPDGSKLLYITPFNLGAGTPGQSYLINADGSGKRLLSDIGRNPAWSPDSRWLFWTDVDGITVFKPDGSEQHLIPLLNLVQAQWVPDSHHISYIQRLDKDSNETALYVMPFNN